MITDQEKRREITLTIYGEPVPQGRPKVARIGGRVVAYDPPQKSKVQRLGKTVGDNPAKTLRRLYDIRRSYMRRDRVLSADSPKLAQKEKAGRSIRGNEAN